MGNFLDELSGIQREAVCFNSGPSLVVAGAGSGKTRVLTNRAAYLIEDLGVNPYNIMMITFTNKAAAEMKERGENTFKDFFVPEAYMEMRQGLGRLLRSEEDSGKVLILDNRIVKETYGKTFARIWNFKHSQANSVSDILEFVK